MVYLAIMVLVAAAGIFRLWMLQRRERMTLDSVDTFWAGLERIGQHVDPQHGRSDGPARRRFGRKFGSGLDPARRKAAKKRIEQRRRAHARRAAHKRTASRRRARPGSAPTAAAVRRKRVAVHARSRARTAQAARRATTGSGARRAQPRPRPVEEVAPAPETVRSRSGSIAARRETAGIGYQPAREVAAAGARRHIDLRDAEPSHVLVRWPQSVRERDDAREIAIR